MSREISKEEMGKVLHYICSDRLTGNRTEEARHMINEGADVNAKNNAGEPTYQMASFISTDVASIIKSEIERRSLQANVAQVQAQPIKKKAKAYI